MGLKESTFANEQWCLEDRPLDVIGNPFGLAVRLPLIPKIFTRCVRASMGGDVLIGDESSPLAKCGLLNAQMSKGTESHSAARPTL
jgi:hypothetical protein